MTPKEYDMPVLEAYDVIERLLGYNTGKISRNNSTTAECLLFVLDKLYQRDPHQKFIEELTKNMKLIQPQFTDLQP